MNDNCFDFLNSRYVTALIEAGYDSEADIRQASYTELNEIDGIGSRVATKIKNEIGHANSDGDILNNTHNTTGRDHEQSSHRNIDIGPKDGERLGDKNDSIQENSTDDARRSVRNIDSLRPRHTNVLEAAGYESVEDVHRASYTDLTDISGIGSRIAVKIKKEVGHIKQTQNQNTELQNDNLDADGNKKPIGTTDRQSMSAHIPKEIPTASSLDIDYEDIKQGDMIGCGGNANVYKATIETSANQCTVALKRPRVSGTLHSESIERLLSEAKKWQKLDNHDHIVDVIDYRAEPLPWIAMEYMDGGHLGEYAGEVPFEQALWTALSVTKGVRHAHDYGVAHLDLKPENILFRSVDTAWDIPKVADWGLSKQLLEHSMSVDGMSPRYAAPEQFDPDTFGPTDKVTDVYQLGAVFYELFTGSPPFEGKTYEVIDKIRQEDPTPPSELMDIPAELNDIILTALSTEKSDRYEHVLYLRDDLQNLFDSF